ncbi:hypothetical protein ABI_20320 [Asticcacaulis biprosthecium C19]|uniref:Uncharacterized protein n=1 Tax=Asticcacaulis biprosthecium C19 TaxID=715226 RepID=F4QM18_9CAUL|nr:hypothetical protein ABI_20320 [Asticcacaulis biprosthecium C19]
MLGKATSRRSHLVIARDGETCTHHGIDLGGRPTGHTAPPELMIGFLGVRILHENNPI